MAEKLSIEVSEFTISEEMKDQDRKPCVFVTYGDQNFNTSVMEGHEVTFGNVFDLEDGKKAEQITI